MAGIEDLDQPDDVYYEYIPYFITAEDIVAGDNSPEEYLRNLFPDATETQIASFVLYTVGKVLDGIWVGFAMADNNPIAEVEAFRDGVEKGYNRAIEEL